MKVELADGDHYVIELATQATESEQVSIGAAVIFDGTYGWHKTYRLIDLASDHGMTLDDEDRATVARYRGDRGTASDDDFEAVHDLAGRAEGYMNDQITRVGSHSVGPIRTFSSPTTLGGNATPERVETGAPTGSILRRALCVLCVRNPPEPLAGTVKRVSVVNRCSARCVVTHRVQSGALCLCAQPTGRSGDPKAILVHRHTNRVHRLPQSGLGW